MKQKKIGRQEFEQEKTRNCEFDAKKKFLKSGEKLCKKNVSFCNADEKASSLEKELATNHLPFCKLPKYLNDVSKTTGVHRCNFTISIAKACIMLLLGF